MRRVPPVLLFTPVLAAISVAVVAGGGLGQPLAIQVAAAFGFGLTLGLVRTTMRRRRAAVARQEPAPSAAALAAPPVNAEGEAGRPDGREVEDDEPVDRAEPASPATAPVISQRQRPEPDRATPAHERHRELFDAEYARQLIRIERLREAARLRVAQVGSSAEENGATAAGSPPPSDDG